MLRDEITLNSLTNISSCLTSHILAPKLLDYCPCSLRREHLVSDIVTISPGEPCSALSHWLSHWHSVNTVSQSLETINPMQWTNVTIKFSTGTNREDWHWQKKLWKKSFWIENVSLKVFKRIIEIGVGRSSGMKYLTVDFMISDYKGAKLCIKCILPCHFNKPNHGSFQHWP